MLRLVPKDKELMRQTKTTMVAVQEGSIPMLSLMLGTRCSRVPAGVPWGRGKSRRGINIPGSGNRLKQEAQVFQEGVSLIPPPSWGGRSTKLATLEVMWSLSIGSRHLSSEFGAVKVLWQT